MRHIGTLIAAVLIAPLAWLLLAVGQDHSLQVFADAQSTGVFHPTDFLRPLELLAGAGLVLGLLATLRFSPLGAVMIGLGYTLSYAGLLVAPQGQLDLVNHHLFLAGHRVDTSVPVRNGTTLVLGALLLASGRC